MAEPTDLLRAWQASVSELSRMSASLISVPPEVAGQLGAPLQRQAELVEQILQRQLDFEREVLGRFATPATAVLDLADRTTAAMSAQVTAFRAAATSFGQIADLLEQQVELLQLASRTVRDPVSALGAVGELFVDRAGPEPDSGT